MVKATSHFTGFASYREITLHLRFMVLFQIRGPHFRCEVWLQTRRLHVDFTTHEVLTEVRIPGRSLHTSRRIELKSADNFHMILCVGGSANLSVIVCSSFSSTTQAQILIPILVEDIFTATESCNFNIERVLKGADFLNFSM